MSFTFERGGDIYQSRIHATAADGEYYPMDLATATDILDALVNARFDLKSDIENYTKSEIVAAWEVVYREVEDDC